MRFPREFRSYILDTRAIAGARFGALKISYWFRLHLLAAFVLALAVSPRLVDAVADLRQDLEQIPAGIAAVKAGDALTITGIKQPLTVVDDGQVITIDTTGATAQRPASTTIFISKQGLELVEQPGIPGQKIAWSESEDFNLSLDAFKAYIAAHEGWFVALLAVLALLMYLISSLIISSIIILLGTSVAYVVRKITRGPELLFREILGMHLVAITAPLTLWTVLTIGGFATAPAVEVFAFIVYSVLALKEPMDGPEKEEETAE